tara:strand:- start:1004 stop:1396 length:393 start_codon:yes stop_codon:yes gene_type:complete
MAAGKYNFAIEQGSTVDFTIKYKDSAGNAIDLTDYHARMQIRPDADSSTLYAHLSSSTAADGTGINMTPTDPDTLQVLPKSSGSLQVIISAQSSSAFTFGSAQYDLEIVSGSYVEKIIRGLVSLRKEVTR